MKKLWKRNQIMITALALMIAVAGYLNFMGQKVDKEDLFTTSAQFEEADSLTGDTQTADASVPDATLQDATLPQEGQDDTMATIDDVTQTDELALITEDTGEYDALTDIDSMDSEDEMVYSDYLDENQAEGISDTAQVTEDYDGETPGEAVFTSGMTVSSVEGANLLKEQTREKNKEMLLEIINSDTVSDSAKQSAVDRMITLTDVAQKECSAQILLEAKGFEDVVVSISNDQADVIVKTDQLTDAQRAQVEDIVSRKTGISVENIIISPVK